MKCPNCQANYRYGSDYCSRCGEDRQKDPFGLAEAFAEMAEPQLDKLINDHWNYVAQVMKYSSCEPHEIELAEFHYKSAWKHAVKHERERVAELQAP